MIEEIAKTNKQTTPIKMINMMIIRYSMWWRYHRYWSKCIDFSMIFQKNDESTSYWLNVILFMLDKYVNYFRLLIQSLQQFGNVGLSKCTKEFIKLLVEPIIYGVHWVVTFLMKRSNCFCPVSADSWVNNVNSGW